MVRSVTHCVLYPQSSPLSLSGWKIATRSLDWLKAKSQSHSQIRIPRLLPHSEEIRPEETTAKIYTNLPCRIVTDEVGRTENKLRRAEDQRIVMRSRN